MNRWFLTEVLDDLSRRLYSRFGFAVRLLIYGGAHLVLQQLFKSRDVAEDVNYSSRAFTYEISNRGYQGRENMAAEMLRSCIENTARKFELTSYWMNSESDIFLPMTTEYVGSSFTLVHANLYTAPTVPSLIPSGRTLCILLTWP